MSAIPRAWRAVHEDADGPLARALRSELGPGHVLEGRTAVPVARRDDCDDVAFLVDGTRLCIVHLTYGRGPETAAQWPHAVFVDALSEDDGPP